ncbi:MAG TPA: energy transducer TonB [Acidobacteriaceae bacterium]|nr:energy transducer TonB [Acidobacteriaceae bacterium]
MRRLRRLHVPLFCSLFTLLAAWTCLPLHAAGPTRDVKEDLRSSLLGSDLYLRDFSAARVAHWHWNGSALASDDPTGLHTIAALQIAHVDVSHDVVVLEGTRKSLLKDDGVFSLAATAVPVRLLVTVPHGDQAAVLPQVRSLLFFPSREDAIAALPPVYSAVLPSPSVYRYPRNGERCDCADLGKPECEGKQASLGLRNPKLVSQRNPEFTEEARQQQFSGDVGVVTTVDSTGHTTDLWIARSVGLGLDEAAADSVRQYVFTPGTCHGEPSPIPLAVDVNFQIFAGRRP